MLSFGAITIIILSSITSVLAFAYLTLYLYVLRIRSKARARHAETGILHGITEPPSGFRIAWADSTIAEEDDYEADGDEYHSEDAESGVGQKYHSGIALMDQGSMQTKGVREVKGDREVGVGDGRA